MSEKTCGCNCGCSKTSSETGGQAGKQAGGHETLRPSGFLPEVNFSTFILSLASSALVQLGEVPDPQSGRVERDITLARHSIDILDMLRSKTEKCLDNDERELLNGILYELRMKYVIICGPDCEKKQSSGS